jgi:hypothetical protein
MRTNNKAKTNSPKNSHDDNELERTGGKVAGGVGCETL